MTEPKLATQSRRGRFYSLPAGGPDLPSVTTILDVLAKPALVRWAAKEVAEAAWDDRKALSVMKDREAALKMLKGAPWSRREKAADLGTSVHEVAAVLSAGGTLPSISPTAEPYVDAFLQAVKDLDLDIEITEATVGNRTIGYAGSLDGIGTSGMMDKRFLFDIKTGKGVYPETSLQLAAYRFAEIIVKSVITLDPEGSNIESYHLETDDVEEPMPQVDGAAVLHLKPDGEYAWFPTRADEDTFNVFVALAKVWRWNDEDAKEAFG